MLSIGVRLGKAVVLRYRAEGRQPQWMLLTVESVLADALLVRFGKDIRVAIPRGTTKSFLYRPTDSNGKRKEIWVNVMYIRKGNKGGNTVQIGIQASKELAISGRPGHFGNR